MQISKSSPSDKKLINSGADFLCPLISHLAQNAAARLSLGEKKPLKSSDFKSLSVASIVWFPDMFGLQLI